MTPFEPEGVYSSIPYRVLPDSSIEAMMPGGLVKFKNMDLFLAASGSGLTGTNVERSIIARLVAEHRQTKLECSGADTATRLLFNSSGSNRNS